MLNLHPKTLHRQLKKHDLTFKQLLKEERFNLAKYYLSKSNIQLIQLATILGYSDASALSRSFKNESGMSPQEWKLSIKKS
jgi:AraC-like DNA-binding protein